MRRRTALLVLSALLLLPVVPASAAEPEVSPPAATQPAPATPPQPAPAATPAPVVEISPAPAADASPAGTSEAPPASPAAPPAPEPTPDADQDAEPLDTAGHFIVLLDKGTNAKKVRDRHALRQGVRSDRLYQRAVQGFAGELTPAQVRALERDPDVAAVVPDEIVEVASQLVPTGVSRVGTRSATSTVARIDGVDERVDADVAVVDTGIDPSHPDLNVVGGYNCSTTDPTQWRDVDGHGTHVAGTIGAIDDANGVVGVAPGVRLWAVKILNDEGFGLLSWYVCGLDWIAAQRDPADPSRPLIEAVNMSVAKWGKDGGSCGATTSDILHQAICRVTGAGVTVVAAAANDAGSAAARVPAAYNEVITVSALADTDGKAGGLGGNRCLSWGTYDQDDTFADFSNYGTDVDIIAPGKCIWSTLPGDRYGYSSGTSMAAPAVTGAAALYLASRPWSTPEGVKGALQILGSTNWITSSDPDSNPELLLNVARLGPAGTFAVSLPQVPPVGEVGGTVTLPVGIVRSETHFETLALTWTAPAAFQSSLDQSALTGFTATSATLTLTVPPATPAGRYPVTVTASERVRTHSATVEIVVESDAPTASAPSATLASQAVLGAAGMPVVVSWPPATDPSSAIVGYELQLSTGWADWVAAGSTDGGTFSALHFVANGKSHRFRIRAVDAAGNWSPWAEGAPLWLGILDDRARSIRKSTGWLPTAYAYAQAGTLSRAPRTGSWARVTLSARTVAVVAPVGRRQGWFTVYINGVNRGKVSLYSATGASRRVVWSQTFADTTPKVIELRAVRTVARPRVELDAIVYGK